MARKKADYAGLMTQDFLTKSQAMAYTLRETEEVFDRDIKPYVNIYRAGHGGCYYLPELRKRMLALIEIKALR